MSNEAIQNNLLNFQKRLEDIDFAFLDLLLIIPATESLEKIKEKQFDSRYKKLMIATVTAKNSVDNLKKVLQEHFTLKQEKPDETD